MDIIRWFWMQLICVLGVFKKKSPNTKTGTDPLRWIQPKHRWAWIDRSLEVHAFNERITKMKPHGTLRTMASYDGASHELHVWVGNTYVGIMTVTGGDETIFSDYGLTIESVACGLFGKHLDSVEKLNGPEKKFGYIRSSMSEAFRKKLLARHKIWQVACSNGIMVGRGSPILTRGIVTEEDIRSFADATNPGLRKLFACTADVKSECYEALRRLLSGPLGRKLKISQVSYIATLSLDLINALVRARNEGSLRKVVQRACSILGIPKVNTLEEYKAAMAIKEAFGFVWYDALQVNSFGHWMFEYRNLSQLGFQMPFTLQEMMAAWKEFRYFDFFRMAKIIDLTLNNTRGSESFGEAERVVVESKVLDQCRTLLPDWHHAIMKAKHLLTLGKKMNFCVGYYASQVEHRSYVVVLSTKKGEKPVTTGLTVRNGFIQFQQSHLAGNATDLNCTRMSLFRPFVVQAEQQNLQVSYPNNAEVLELQNETLCKLVSYCVYKAASGRFRAYAERSWFKRHFDYLVKQNEEVQKFCYERTRLKQKGFWPV